MNAMTRTSVLFGSLMLMAGSSAWASPVVEANVPFPFTVQGHVLPAGQYRVERDAYDQNILLIKGEHGVRAVAIAESSTAPGQDPAGDKPALVFAHGPAGYRLKDVWDDHFDGREVIAR